MRNYKDLLVWDKGPQVDPRDLPGHAATFQRKSDLV